MRKVFKIIIPFLLFSFQAMASSMDFELFQPSLTNEGSFITESPSLMKRRWSVGTYLQIEKTPVSLVREGKFQDEMVDYRFQIRGIFSMNLLNFIQLGVDFPWTLLADHRGEPHQTYLNDMIISAKYRIPYSLFDNALTFGLIGYAKINSGKAEKWGGLHGRFMEPGISLLSEYRYRNLYARLNIGYQEKDKTVLEGYDIKIDDKFLYRVGIGYYWKSNLVPFMEYVGQSQTDKIFRQIEHDAQELYIGVQKCWKDFVLTPGFGIGLTRAFGVPAWRFLFGFFYPSDGVCGIPVMVAKKPLEKGRVTIGVIDERGEAVDGAVVNLTGEESIEKSSKLGIAEFALPPGNYKTVVKKEGYQPLETSIMVIGGITKEIELKLTPIPQEEKEEEKENLLSRISFLIVDFKSGEPVKEGNVFILERNIEEVFKEGKWHILLLPGNYQVTFSSEGYYPKTLSLPVEFGNDKKFQVKLVKMEKEEKVVVTEEEIYILDKIYFKTASYEIMPKSYPILDALADTLKKHKEIKKVLIKGHTDNVGKRTYNLKLSENRAKSVMEYLIKKGIERERLDYKGYGPDVPIADNSTEEGRAMNRRVEFEIIEKEVKR